MKYSIPQEVIDIVVKLKEAGFKVYIVGGCVRDLLLENPPVGGPKDWDIATDAKPEEIQKLFEDSVYENRFGTVGVKTRSENKTIAIVEVTTFRREEKYSDLRHPDKIEFADSIEEDLSRRDFTINAIALSSESELVDPYGGQKDIKGKLIRAVGDPNKRFSEDALRLIRAVRLSAELGFNIEEKTEKAIKKSAKLIDAVAEERIRDELIKILMSNGDGPKQGLLKLEELGLLRYIIPELCEGVGVEQNMHHIYDVFEHNIKSLEYAVEKNFSLELRLASLLHDVGKPGTRKWKNDTRGKRVNRGRKGDWTFYQHQYLGEKLARNILRRLKFPKEVVRKVSLLVREHMFVYDPDVVTERGVRRLLRRVGEENADDLIKLREADRIGSGVPKAQPYRLRHLQAMIEKAKTEPVSVKQLKVNGDMLIGELGMEPGPRMGYILAILLDEVIEEPKKNTRTYLLEKVNKLEKLSDKDLEKMADKARESAAEVQKRIDDSIKEKYFVK